MFSTCSELTPRAPIPDGRMERIMQPWVGLGVIPVPTYSHLAKKCKSGSFAGSYEITLKTAGWHEWRVGVGRHLLS